jgi:hypothetical protein
MNAAHDVRDRRAVSIHRHVIALENIALDADAIAKGELDPAVGYDIARRARKAAKEAEKFRARDLLNLREQAGQ